MSSVRLNEESDEIIIELVEEQKPIGESTGDEKPISFQAKILIALGYNNFSRLEEPRPEETTAETQLEVVNNRLAELELELTKAKKSFDCGAYSALSLMTLCIILAYCASSMGIESPALPITLSILTILAAVYLSCLKYQQCVLGNEVTNLQDEKIELEHSTRNNPSLRQN